MQWAEPVTGSSGTPLAGPKKRDTKSQSRPGAVTITAKWPMRSSAPMSGASERTSSSESNTAM